MAHSCFQFSLRTAFIAFIAASLAVGGTVSCVRYYAAPPPLRLWRMQNSELNAFAIKTLDNNFQSASAYRSPAGVGKDVPIPRFLDGCDVHHISVTDGVVEITFTFMPTDAVPVLIYSPSGLKGLPPGYQKPGPTYSYFKQEKLDEHWFYCEWDN